MSYSHILSNCQSMLYIKFGYKVKGSYINAAYYTIFKYSSVKVSHNHGMWDRHSMVWNHFMFRSYCMIASQYIAAISKDSQSLIILNSHSKAI